MIGFEALLARMFDPGQPPDNLDYLSDLGGKALELFRQNWPKAAVERRRQIIHRLVQLHASEALVNFDEIFLFALGDDDEVVRIQAIRGLDESDDRRLVLRLLYLLQNDSSGLVRSAVVSALGRLALVAELGKLDRDSSSAIYAALQEVLRGRYESLEMKCQALEAIAVFSFPEVRNSIERAYHSSNLQVRASSLRAMGRNCNPLWIPSLIAEMTSSRPLLRGEAALACGEIASDEAVPHLLTLASDPEDNVNEAAVRALGEIGGSKAQEVLRKLLGSVDGQIGQAVKASLAKVSFLEEPLSFEF